MQDRKKKQMINLLYINGWEVLKMVANHFFRAIRLRNILENEPESRLSWNFRSTKSQLRIFLSLSLILPESDLAPLLLLLRASFPVPTCFPSRFSVFLLRGETRQVHFSNHAAYLLLPRNLIRGNISLANICTLFRCAISRMAQLRCSADAFLFRQPSLIIHAWVHTREKRMHGKKFYSLFYMLITIRTSWI